MAIKALAGRRFSLLAFGVAQVAMDIEPLVGLARGSDVLHGATHTYLGAICIAAVVTVISGPLCCPILRRWNRELAFHQLAWLIESESITFVPVIAGAFAGTLSHVILDNVMHSDISPLAPWSHANAMLGLISIGALHQFCIFSGLFGVACWLAVGWCKRPRVRAGEQSRGR